MEPHRIRPGIRRRGRSCSLGMFLAPDAVAAQSGFVEIVAAITRQTASILRTGEPTTLRRSAVSEEVQAPAHLFRQVLLESRSRKPDTQSTPQFANPSHVAAPQA